MSAYSNRDIMQMLVAHAPELMVIDPMPDPKHIQPCSVDLPLWHRFYDRATEEWTEISEGSSFVLPPLSFILGSTEAVITVPKYLRSDITGKSSYGRLGLFVHITAGLLDPGFGGRVVLEFFNCSSLPIHLIPGEMIAQVTFTELKTPADPAYGDPWYNSHYQGQMDVEPSRFDRKE
jgi:dCTP deaminase